MERINWGKGGEQEQEEEDEEEDDGEEAGGEEENLNSLSTYFRIFHLRSGASSFPLFFPSVSFFSNVICFQKRLSIIVRGCTHPSLFSSCPSVRRSRVIFKGRSGSP